jgi:hypothetical protein
LIFLTPHIIAAPTEVAAITDVEQDKLKASKSLTEDELSRFLDQLPTKDQPPVKKKK